VAEITISGLRRHAIAATLFVPTTLKQAIEKLGFVQCDPIRAPARAQDLILRLRAEDYRAGDLERCYPDLGIEEDYLYAYGFVPEATWRLLHPRMTKRLSKMEERVRQLVCAQAKLHPRELEAHLGRKREVNPWGSYSKATTRTLEALHYRGLLRIAGRENGIRVYQAAREQEEYLAPEERLRKLTLLIASILAPVPERSLRAALRHLGHAAPTLPDRPKVLKKLLDSGELSRAEVQGIRYVWPAGELCNSEGPPEVRFLAPFDPLVWDRYRFEHLWGWAYRFEAYTPPAKRRMGYYALPLLWREEVIGWVNVTRNGGGFEAEAGFVKAKPKERLFQQAFEREVDRLSQFLTREPDSRSNEGAGS
jgi:uncharacterized protein YcaQ